MKFMNLSPSGTDFYSKLQSQLRLINGNVLYLTREIDQVKKILMKLELDKGLQKQVDDYFDDETSPQTDSEEQDGSKNS